MQTNSAENSEVIDLLSINDIIRLTLDAEAEFTELTDEKKTEILLKILTLYLESRLNLKN